MCFLKIPLLALLFMYIRYYVHMLTFYAAQAARDAFLGHDCCMPRGSVAKKLHLNQSKHKGLVSPNQLTVALHPSNLKLQLLRNCATLPTLEGNTLLAHSSETIIATAVAQCTQHRSFQEVSASCHRTPSPI